MIMRKRSHWLANMINERGYKTGAELGAATGVTTDYLLRNCPGLKRLIIADIWIPVGTPGHPWSRDDMEDVFRHKFSREIDSGRVVIFKGLSWEMAKHVQDGSLDFVFVDANHEKECVKKDVTAWLPKLKVGGLLCGHDLHSEGVVEAIEELLPGWKDTKIDHVWYYFKKKVETKAFQGYEAKGMGKFRWLKSFGLSPYESKKRPAVFFGCYKPEDLRVIYNHKAAVFLVWMGNDTHKREKDFIELAKLNIIHVTWLPDAQKYLINRGIDCKLLKLPVKEYPRPDPMVLGNKVYAYLAKGKPEYHGSEVVESLNINYPLLIGDNSVGSTEWYNGMNNRFYSQVFIGLALSDYVGGGMSIQEMAVRGIRVITNVLNLPNCIPWETKEDVERIINEEAKKIGQSNNGLVEEVYDKLVEVRGCFDLEKLMV